MQHFLVFFALLFSTIHAGTQFPAASTCQSANLISSLPYDRTLNLPLENTLNSLTNKCVELVSRLGQAWWKYIAPYPQEVSFTMCAHGDITTDVSFTIETTGYEDCEQSEEGICTNAIASNIALFCSDIRYPRGSQIRTILIPEIPYYLRIDYTSAQRLPSLRVRQVEARADLVPRNDECGGAIDVGDGYSESESSTMYATVSSFPCSDIQTPTGDVFYSFNFVGDRKQFVACADWEIKLFLLDNNICPVDTAEQLITPERLVTPGCLAQASKIGSCATLSTDITSGFVVVSGETPLSRGSFTFSVSLPNKLRPTVICPHDLKKTISTCSFGGSTGNPTVISPYGGQTDYTRSVRPPYPVGRTLITFTGMDRSTELTNSCVQTLTVESTANCPIDQ